MKAATGKSITQEGGLLNFLSTLMKVSLPIIKIVLTPLAKNVLMPSRLTAVASEENAAIQKKVYGSDLTILIILKEEMKDIVKIVKSLEESSLLIKDVSETIENESKVQKGGFLGILFCILGASVLGSMLAGNLEHLDQELFELVKELFELAKEQLEQDGTFNATSSFN